MVDALHRLVGGHHDHRQVVDFQEFVFLGLGGACHAPQLVIHAEVVLEGDGGKGLGFPLDLDTLLGFDGLMQAVGVAAAFHQAPGEFIHDNDFPVPHHIVPVTLHQGLGPESRLEAVGKLDIFRGEHIADAQHLLDFWHRGIRLGHGLLLFIHRVVHPFFQGGHSPGHHRVGVRGFLAGA